MTNSPKRFVCRHVQASGHRCGSPCLRGRNFCYFHYAARYPAPTPPPPPAYISPDAALLLPNFEDRLSIQCALSEVARRIAANQIDPARARLLIYSLQVASSNLGRIPRTAAPLDREAAAEPFAINDLVEDVQLDPALGLLAPIAEAQAFAPPATPTRSPVERFVEEVLQERAGRPARYPNGEPHDPSLPWSPEPTTLPNVRAVADDTPEPGSPTSPPEPPLIADSLIADSSRRTPSFPGPNPPSEPNRHVRLLPDPGPFSDPLQPCDSCLPCDSRLRHGQALRVPQRKAPPHHATAQIPHPMVRLSS